MLRIEIDTSNAVFEPSLFDEVHRCLDGVCAVLACGGRAGTIRDVNGNRVGHFTLTED